MNSIAIRQSGGANIISIPKAIIKSLGLTIGTELDLTIEHQKIVLTPVNKKLTLEELLAKSPKEQFKITKEDSEWLNTKAIGEEI